MIPAPRKFSANNADIDNKPIAPEAAAMFGDEALSRPLELLSDGELESATLFFEAVLPDAYELMSIGPYGIADLALRLIEIEQQRRINEQETNES